MNGHGWKEYFIFTKKERTGVIVLLALIIIIYAVPEFFPEERSLKVFYRNDSLKTTTNDKKFQQEPLTGDEGMAAYKPDNGPSRNNAPNTARFEFDPNTLQEDGWKRLGVSERTIKTIMNFRSKGGKFRHPEDLRKIYGMNQVLCEQLIPLARIPKFSSTSLSNKESMMEKKSGAFEPEILKESNDTRTGSDVDRTQFRNSYRVIKPIEINAADSVSWEQLPGIGGKLASRIIMFRERLGGFYTVRQVAETFGLSDSTFKIILPYLSCNETTLRKTNINELTAPELARHPYIRWPLANAIVNYRNQHGSFRNVSDLQSVTAIPADVLEKLQPYLSVK